MLLAVCGTKGGVGKSAFAMQVAAPYVYDRFGSCSLIEIDDFNFDSDDYKNSMISCSSQVVEKGAARVIDSLIKKIAQEENIVLDVGGNQTCGTMIEALGKSAVGGMINGFIIPVSQTGKDVENARKTIELIRKYMGSKPVNIFLGVTRIGSTETLQDVEYNMPDLIELASDEQVLDILLLPDDVSVPASRKLGMSVWELAISADAHIDTLNEQLLEEQCREERDVTAMSAINRHVMCVENARHYLPVLQRIFGQLDQHFARPVSSQAQPTPDAT